LTRSRPRRTPAVVLFDVNETLSNLEALRGRFDEIGVPGDLLRTWFASTLRDGFALAAAGAYADFQSVAIAALRPLLAQVDGLNRSLGDGADHVIRGMGELDLHPDVPEGMRLLNDAGVRMATLTNGSAEQTQGLLERGGVASLIERTLSVKAVGRWKPAPEPYLYASRELGVAPDEVALIASHPWDIGGAKWAGLLGGWLNRSREEYPEPFPEPDAVGEILASVARGLLE
jgi:2-haloacid dehalogenase